MELSFENRGLESCYEDNRTCKGCFGARTKQILTRFQQAKAANTLADLRNMPGHWEELAGSRKGEFSVRISGNWRLLFRPVGKIDEIMEKGSYVWEKITKICFIGIIDYH